MSINTDFHSHIVPSSAGQMIQQAKEKDLRVLGISEHAFQIGEVQPLLAHMPLEGPILSSFEDYFERIKTAAEQFQFDVRVGLEVDFVPDKNIAIWQVLEGQPWDFLIGSVHEVNGVDFQSRHKWSREEGEALWLRYYELLRAAVSSEKFSVVSHPVRMRASNPFLPPRLDEELEHLAAEATRHNVALEINGCDILSFPSLVKRLARACALQRAPISIGSDAHDPTEVAQGHRLSEELLREVGIERVRIWKSMGPEEYSI